MARGRTTATRRARGEGVERRYGDCLGGACAPPPPKAHLVVAHCRASLAWLHDRDIIDLTRFETITVASKCGVAPEPPREPGADRFETRRRRD